MSLNSVADVLEHYAPCEIVHHLVFQKDSAVCKLQRSPQDWLAGWLAELQKRQGMASGR